MITLRAVTLPGSVSGPLPSATFGPDGGTIGRADTNTMVLEDPDRMISRVHAQIMRRPRGYVLIDRGSNPVSVNGQQLGAGKEVPVKSGDQIQIGNYVLAVEGGDDAAAPPAIAAPAPAAGGMSDPLGLFSNQVAPAAPPAGRAPPAAFGDFGVPGAASQDPFADLLPASAPAKAPAFAAPPSAYRGGGGIPDDWDPLADPLGEPPKKAAPDQLPDDFDFGASLSNAPATSRDLDQMLGIGAGAKPLDSRDPFLGTALGDPLANPNTAPSGDALAALYGTHDAGQRAEQDQVLEVHGAFVPPKAELPPLDDLLPPLHDVFAPAPPPPAGPAQALSSPDPFADLIPPPPAMPSSPPVGGHVISPSPAPVTPAPPAPAAKAAEAPAPLIKPDPAPAPLAPAPVRATTSGPVSQDELLKAFLTGLGVEQTRLEAVTPELMQLVGTLLRDATEGTLQLLLTRQETKREVQAEVTMIMASKNNPLKFSPTVEHALALMLEPPTRGFMAPGEAMRDAYEDLRAHQFGVMAGMRAALEGVIAKFSPDQLEKRLTDKTMLDSLFAGSRKAKLWDQFVALYGDIAQETNDDFQAIFGRAFVKAYQEQVDRLKQK